MFLWVSFRVSSGVLSVSLGFHLGFDDNDDEEEEDDDVDEMNGNQGVNVRHPSAQMDDTENLTKHWPCAVKTHFPGQHIRPGRI